MGGRKIIIGMVLVTVLILVGGVALLSGNGATSANITTSQNAKISTDQRNFDWGTIPMKGGNVSKTFILKSTGSEVLKITNIKTSCHCTKAQLIINGQSSPAFGMNAISSWIGEVPPGQQAELLVIFDPAYHGINGVGPITRYISIATNDPNNVSLEFTLTAKVIK